MLSASRVMASMLQDFEGVLPVDYLVTEILSQDTTLLHTTLMKYLQDTLEKKKI